MLEHGNITFHFFLQSGCFVLRRQISGVRACDNSNIGEFVVVVYSTTGIKRNYAVFEVVSI